MTRAARWPTPARPSAPPSPPRNDGGRRTCARRRRSSRNWTTLTTLWGRKVVGILGGEGRSEVLIGALIKLNAQGRFPCDRLIQVFPLDQLNEALEASHRGEVVKPILTMP